jgi:predicted dehydrogenase
MRNPINVALIGGGGFAYFAVSEFVKVPDVKFIGVFDEIVGQCERFKEIDKDIKVYSEVSILYEDEEVDLIYIATPPYLHYEQSKRALLSGKHVICEKPAAITLGHAVELRKIAADSNLLFVVNLMQRYNPLFDSVKLLIDRNSLGEFLHGYFENYASDESLLPSHWFWDESKSGGIFIEHGVHFFDLFSGWLGEGKVIASQKLQRKGYENMWDRVQANVLYRGGIVNFYHGFDQPKIMDRQQMRLQFERGEVTLSEWVPTRLTLNALCSVSELDFLRQLFPASNISIVERPKGELSHGRFREINYQYKVMLETNDEVQKQTLYKELVRRMLEDQLQWLRNRSHKRKIDQDNAVDSLRVAYLAEAIAHRIRS